MYRMKKKCSMKTIHLFCFLFIILFFVYIFWIKKEGFSGSLHASDLQDVTTSESALIKDREIIVNNPIDSSYKQYPTRKHATNPTLSNYDSIYKNILSSNNYITLPPTPTLSLPTLNRKMPIVLLNNTFVTSPGMNTSMTELPKLKNSSLFMKKYDTVYQDAISQNKYDTVF